MILDGIIPLYKEIIKNKETYCVFPFTKNKIEFDVFFDIEKTPFRLGFLVIKSNFQLWLNVTRGFNISTVLDREDYKRLKDLLGLKYDPANPFSTTSFFEEFNKKIPAVIPVINSEHRKQLILYSYSIEERDRLFYAGLYEWDKLGSDKKRSLENLEKTRLLLPELYNQIKDRNVSVRYSATESAMKPD